MLSYFRPILEIEGIGELRPENLGDSLQLLHLEGTSFQLAVWKAMLEIPYGETRTYGQLATAIGRPAASRAVGQAANRNPCWIVIPCHRIVGSNHSLTGYAGGLSMKGALLELEKS